jgi:inner membrane transporter RhtA
VPVVKTLQRSPAMGMVATGAVSVQFGAALATKLFRHVGPAGAVTLRLAVAAVLLVVALRIAVRHRATVEASAAPDAQRRHSDWVVAGAFGLVLAGMNLTFYEAIARVPLGVAVTVEFLGPLAVALLGSRRFADGLWACGAAAGVGLLATGVGRHLNGGGLLFALLAGSLWAAYILLSQETGRRFIALDGLAWAMAVGAAAVLPFGLASGGTRLFLPSVLALGTAVALLSSVVPYSLELLALRRVTSRAFGVMMSMEPAMATAAGFLILGQHLTLQEWVALGLVAGANLGNSLSGRSAGVLEEPVGAPS